MSFILQRVINCLEHMSFSLFCYMQAPHCPVVVSGTLSLSLSLLSLSLPADRSEDTVIVFLFHLFYTQDQETALQWRTRLSIGVDTARGIVHLHTTFEKPLIHRDIKSANILLDHQMVPKVRWHKILVVMERESAGIVLPEREVSECDMAPC